MNLEKYINEMKELNESDELIFRIEQNANFAKMVKLTREFTGAEMNACKHLLLYVDSLTSLIGGDFYEILIDYIGYLNQTRLKYPVRLK